MPENADCQAFWRKGTPPFWAKTVDNWTVLAGAWPQQNQPKVQHNIMPTSLELCLPIGVNALVVALRNLLRRPNSQLVYPATSLD